ncbi:alpha/beta hydrolase [Pseudomaricurvus alcaniphilus]|uniref:alpha/beta fold hydrolase n=1 Tax=Pseudomaricurvus alcaniphilus TaxID=1166482 RepID=UPI00140AE84C|nr:alpha/beta hydrolase [Pseudomaricurvus alcaniphilus]NHN35740.1 alpha/beta hydrolase [Pseudomaricurvus alcaniphilus]
MSELFYLVLALFALLFLAYLFAPLKLVEVFLKLARRMCGYRTKTVSVDGYQWHYLDSGGEGKEVLVLVHGFGANKDNWLTYGRLFTKHYRVIVPDLPGFGDNRKDPSLSYHVTLQTDRLQGFFRQLGLGPVHLVGNSMGGYIATLFALKYPEQLKSVLLMNSAGVKGTRQSWLERNAVEGKNPLVINTIEQMDDLFARISHRPLKFPGPVKNYMFLDMKTNHDFYDGIFWELLGTEGEMPYLNEQLQQITVPLMVVWGSEDQLLDVSCAYVIKEKLPSATLLVLEQVGHIPMIEATHETAARHLEFLSKLAPA